MKFLKSDFMKALNFLMPAIGESDSRANLKNIFVQVFDGERVLMTAANGFLIKRVYLEAIGPTSLREFFIPGRYAKIFKQLVSSFGKTDQFEEIGIFTNKLEFLGSSVTYNQPQVDYPKLDKLCQIEKNLKPYEGKFTELGLGAEFLQDALKGFGGDYKKVVKMIRGNPEQPVRFVSQCGCYLSVIMPVRIIW